MQNKCTRWSKNKWFCILMRLERISMLRKKFLEVTGDYILQLKNLVRKKFTNSQSKTTKISRSDADLLWRVAFNNFGLLSRSKNKVFWRKSLLLFCCNLRLRLWQYFIDGANREVVHTLPDQMLAISAMAAKANYKCIFARQNCYVRISATATAINYIFLRVRRNFKNFFFKFTKRPQMIFSIKICFVTCRLKFWKFFVTNF